MQLQKTIQVLVDSGVEFVIIGGVAATLHGSARVTYDLDICYSRRSANLVRLAKALEPFHPRPRGFPAGLPFFWDSGTLRNSTILTLQTDIGELDLLSEVSGLGGFDEVDRRSIFVSAFGREFRVLDLDGLIDSKRAAAREKDISALPELESLRESRDLEEE